jgi:hypothetical protein
VQRPPLRQGKGGHGVPILGHWLPGTVIPNPPGVGRCEGMLKLGLFDYCGT